MSVLAQWHPNMEDLYFHVFTKNNNNSDKCIYCGQFDFAASLYCEEADQKPTFENSVAKALTESAFDRMDRKFKK